MGLVAGAGALVWRAEASECDRDCPPEAERDDMGCCLAKLPPKPAPAGSDFESGTLGKMKWIPAGTFTMGSAEIETELGRDADEVQHSVTLSRGYWMMEHEVTQSQWRAVMGSDPSYFPSCGDSCPVEQVTWEDARAFAQRASERDGMSYQLPTEAEWEYAARGGQSTAYAGSDEPGSVGWYDENSGDTTHGVCQKARNGYGLCDMSGNVWEWTADWYDAYPTGSGTDPVGPQSGPARVARGGCWYVAPAFARVANRSAVGPGNRDKGVGFRLSRTSP